MTSPSTARRFPRSPRRTAAAASVVVTLLALGACAGGGEDSMPADAGGSANEVPAETADRDALMADTAGGAVEQEPEMKQAIISTGNVALESEDVEQAAFDVQQLVDEYGGQITDQKTNTDDEGEVRHARMVVRVPAEGFHEAFADLEAVADLTSSHHSSEDVTTQIIDNRMRIRAQRRSIQRIEVLLDRAQSIRDIVTIESELTRRQADLDSLEQRQAYLQDQTSLSTITVSIERVDEQGKSEKEEDEAGFLAGLSGGWDALKSLGTALATVAGAVLPFAVVALLVGVPAWLLARAAVRRRPKAPADATS